MRILGAVLAGGRSRRFGSDKAEALLDGRPLLDHAIAALAPHVEALVVCGRDVPGLRSLADRPVPDLGPLGALSAALHAAACEGFDGVLTTACDMPFFPAELAAALIGPGPAVLRGQQLAGYWPAALTGALDAHLAATDDHSVAGWLRAVDGCSVALPTIAMPNVNTVADLAALAQQHRQQQQ